MSSTADLLFMWEEVCESMDIFFYRMWTLETTCQEKEKLLSDERGKLQKLKEDFKYNLRLLAERDQELDRYDASFTGIKNKGEPCWSLVIFYLYSIDSRKLSCRTRAFHFIFC